MKTYSPSPKYIDECDISLLSPQQRFTYAFKWLDAEEKWLPIWDKDLKKQKRDENGQLKYKKNGEPEMEPKHGETPKVDALRKVCQVFSTASTEQLNGILSRQTLTAKNLGDAVFSLPAESLSPFMTGTGMEHPLENGFAFLAPYGLPYLPGSGVKGVLRRTAEYLRDLEFGESDCGWNQPAIDILFGPEPVGDEDGHRGALVFWDVYIQPKDYKLGMDILTPHYTEYYKGETTPHDSGQPVPVPFLVVPPEAKFQFHIQCNTEYIVDENIKKNWRNLVKGLLEHCFDWLGFGAKTASGYGQLISLEKRALEAELLRKENLKESGINVGSSVWKNAILKSTSPNTGEISIENAETKKLAAGKFLSSLSDKTKKRFKDKKQVLLDVEIEEQGNMILIKSITEVS